jgi:hypothetical protein
MQRSIPHKRTLKNSFIYIFLFVLYESLSSVYLFLPPLFAVLFVLLIHSLNQEDTIGVALIAFCLVIFEAEKGYILFSSIIYLLLAYKFILPKIAQNFNCVTCIKFTNVFIAYIGFYLFNTLISYIFLVDLPNVSYYIIYYIIIEFFIVSML